MMIIDSKTIQNTDTAEEKALKKTGVKLHIAVNTFKIASHAQAHNC